MRSARLSPVLRRPTNARERPPIRQRAGAHDTAKVDTEITPGPEARLRRHSLNREIGRFEQPLRATNARHGDPGRLACCRRGPGSDGSGSSCSSPPAARSRRAVRLGTSFVHPCQQRGNRTRCIRGGVVFDELRLPTRAFERHRGKPRQPRPRLNAEIAADEMEFSDRSRRPRPPDVITRPLST